MTDKQRCFAAEYLSDFNATNAAIRAGYSENRRSASVTGSRLLKNTNVRAMINMGMEAAVDQGMANMAEVGHFLTKAMRDPSAPWAARMMAASALLKRLPMENNEDVPVIVDNIAYGRDLEGEEVCFRINGRPVKAEHMFALLGLDGPGEI